MSWSARLHCPVCGAFSTVTAANVQRVQPSGSATAFFQARCKNYEKCCITFIIPLKDGPEDL